jgi:hypothetical protein
MVWKVARLKDIIIEHAGEENYDYLFLVDSDLVLHPLTLKQLLSQGKEIISNIFWTRWQPGTIEMPQVWLEDQYTLYKKNPLEIISDEEANNRIHEFLNQLRVPGVYEVGGLGACTLISRSALQAGVCFKEIKICRSGVKTGTFASVLRLWLFVICRYALPRLSYLP